MDSQLTVVEQSELDRNEAVIQQGLRTFVDVGNALAAIRDGRLYRQDYKTFEDYCRDRWGFGSDYARRQIRAAQTIENLKTEPIGSVFPTTESQVRPLARLEPDEQVVAWREAVETSPNGKVTAAHVTAVVNQWNAPSTTPSPVPAPAPHVSRNSGENEWYTPAVYIEAARAVMGAIDLDPASSDIANETVQAATYYTAENDGLARSWLGRVWMNPPYSQPLIGLFCNALRWAIESEQVTEAITLTNNATETAWFADLLANAAAVCFTSTRVKFVDRYGNASGAPLQGQAIIYSGPNIERFTQEFKRLGAILYVGPEL